MCSSDLFNNVDPKRDTMIVEGPVDVLDHSSPLALVGSKIGFDATRKLMAEGHPREWPEDIVMSPDIITMVTSKWRDYGIE